MRGQLLGIFIAEKRSKEMCSVQSASVHAGRGIEGDRYYDLTGTFSKNSKKSRDITVIEIESVFAIKRDYGIEVAPKDLRRNLLTTNIALNHFVGRKLKMGDVVVQGIELCEPCSYLSDLLNHPVKDVLKHRGGLRCQILFGGVLYAGMEITAEV